MENHKDVHIAATAAAISYIESHLGEKMDLGRVAAAVHYSKFYLHRMFTRTVGITVHGYIQRRQLTEAARLLVFSAKPILDIAWLAGYESQQAFTGVFKSMYKQTPMEYRGNQAFYPLQLECVLNHHISEPGSGRQWICYATQDDIPAWMDFLPLVVDGFPCLEEREYGKRLEAYVGQRQALAFWDGDALVGAATFSRQAGSIDFLGVHPQSRGYGVAEALLDFMRTHIFGGHGVSITTFRQGDPADTGQREGYKRLGFVESELLTEFGYPTQRMVLLPFVEGVGK